MDMLKAVLLSLPLVACVSTEQDSTPSNNAGDAVDAVNNVGGCLPPLPANSEYAYYNDRVRIITFTGYYSDSAETFFIWNLGTTIQHGAPYPSDDHGKLYGVFTPSPCGAVHHVAGQDQWDHYHIITQGIGVRTFDVELVFPGPNFNAATYHPPLSLAEMNDAVSAGILAPPLLTTDAGFDPLVIKVPVI